MTVGRICSRITYLAAADESIRAAAQRMQKEHVGTLFVLDASQRPKGVITDRDVALRCVADGRDPEHTPVAAVMSRPVVTVSESTSIEDALGRMSAKLVRRVAVTDPEGRLVGVLALDDVLELLAEENAVVGRILRSSTGHAMVGRSTS